MLLAIPVREQILPGRELIPPGKIHNVENEKGTWKRVGHTLFTKRSANWFHPVIRMTLVQWPWAKVKSILSNGLGSNCHKFIDFPCDPGSRSDDPDSVTLPQKKHNFPRCISFDTECIYNWPHSITRFLLLFVGDNGQCTNSGMHKNHRVPATLVHLFCPNLKTWNIFLLDWLG